MSMERHCHFLTQKISLNLSMLSLVLSFNLGTMDVWAKAWNSSNNPELMAKETKNNYEYNFQKLPLEGSLSQKPWTDDYWPTYKRGLAQRWQGDLNPVKHPDETDEEFAIRKNKKMFFTEKELLFMSEEERNKLSPAEKFDIINGDLNYSLTRSELRRTREDAPRWEGICHGWAAASLHFDEPESCKVSFGPGNFFTGRASLPFASSDIKSLLSLLQGNYNTNRTSYFAGTRCNDKYDEIDWENSEHDNDINAGAFHVILANRIALNDKGFVFDRTKDQEVWNQPVEGFRTRILKEQAPDKALAAPGTAKEVVVESIVDYTVEIHPHTEALNKGDRMSFVVNEPYQYILELDADDNIIGGRWISTDYPDFVWSRGKAPFEGPLKNLKKIYKKSTGRWFF